ncbi:MAG: formyltransferase family protein [Acidimicrobiia bacterium]|nr:formyltransferase family protein [Acidimicrobiia bacterium]
MKQAALEAGIAVTDELASVTEVGADLGVVVAYGRLIGSDVLDALPLVNLHFSLLPRWRGAAPVERALLAGDERTGVCRHAGRLRARRGRRVRLRRDPHPPRRRPRLAPSASRRVGDGDAPRAPGWRFPRPPAPGG